jgi:hypothetical protein
LAPSAPQSGGVSVTGDIHSTGGDMYLANTKALRVDGQGTTYLFLGNWGAGASGFDLYLQGALYANRYGGDLFLDDGATVRIDNKSGPTTLNFLNNDGGGISLNVGGAIFADSIDASQSVSAPSFCLGASCISAWPSGGGGGGGGGTITAVTAGTGLTGGGNSGSVQLSADTSYFNTQYINASGNDVMSGSLTANGLLSTTGAAFGGYALDATWKVSAPNAYLGNGVSGTIIGAGAGQNAGDITTDGVLFAKTSLHAPKVTGDTQLCIGQNCINAWPAQGITQEVDTLDTVMVRGNSTGVSDLFLGQNAASATLVLGDTNTTNRWIDFGKQSNIGYYNSSAQFDIEPTVYFQGGLDVPGGALNASVPVQVSGADVTVQGGKVLSTGAGSGICTDSQTGNCSGANAPVAGAVKAKQLCLPGVAPLGGCINDWTIGGGGDITDVVAGNGLTNGGANGAVTLHVGAGQGIVVAADTVALDSAYTDTLYVKKTGDSMSGKLTITNLSQVPGSYGLDVSGSAGAALFSNQVTGASAQLGSGAFGVIGNGGGSGGTGVYGATGSGIGVSGYAWNGGFAVQGYASGTTNGVGIYGEGDKYGVWGQSLQPNGYALYGSGRLYVSDASTLAGGANILGTATVSGSVDAHGLSITNGSAVFENTTISSGYSLTLNGVAHQQWPVWSAAQTQSGSSSWKNFDCPNNLYTVVAYTCYYGAVPTACATKMVNGNLSQLWVYIPSASSATVTLNCQL